MWRLPMQTPLGYVDKEGIVLFRATPFQSDYVRGRSLPETCRRGPGIVHVPVTDAEPTSKKRRVHKSSCPTLMQMEQGYRHFNDPAPFTLSAGWKHVPAGPSTTEVPPGVVHLFCSLTSFLASQHLFNRSLSVTTLFQAVWIPLSRIAHVVLTEKYSNYIRDMAGCARKFSISSTPVCPLQQLRKRNGPQRHASCRVLLSQLFFPRHVAPMKADENFILDSFEYRPVAEVSDFIASPPSKFSLETFSALHDGNAGKFMQKQRQHRQCRLSHVVSHD